MKKLVIDLGHGGNDPGAIGQGGTHEADIVLDIGKEIEILLRVIRLIISLLGLLIRVSHC